MKILRAQIYYKCEFITSTNLSKAHAQLNHNDIRIRFGAVIAIVCQAFSFAGTNSLPEGQRRPNALERPQEGGGQQRRRLMLDLPGAHSGRFQITSIYSHCVLSYCMYNY